MPSEHTIQYVMVRVQYSMYSNMHKFAMIIKYEYVRNVPTCIIFAT